MSESFSNPQDAVLKLKLRPNMIVADFGCGSGAAASTAAHLVEPNGKVYAIDIQEDLLTHACAPHGHLHAHVESGVVQTIWGDVEKPFGTGLRDHTVDAVLLMNTLFQINNRNALITELKRVLKSEGKLLVVDWAGAYSGMGPEPACVVSEHEAEELFIGNGFHKESGFRSGPHHWGIIFTSA